MRDQTVLMTGFNKFGELDSNPSQLVIEALMVRKANPTANLIVTEVLPTEFVSAGSRIRELIRSLLPDICFCLGVSAKSHSVLLERFALNIDDSLLPDNAGDAPAGRVIVPEGPAAYRSTLPLFQMFDTLTRLNMPVQFSNSAGTYVCNHVFYCAQHEIHKLGLNTICGFTHLPKVKAEASDASDGDATLPLSQVVIAMERCVETICQTIRPRSF